MKGMGLDSRIGPQFLQAGLGYGGSCFPKDVDSLIHTASQLGYDFKLLRAVVEINRERAAHLVDMMRKALGAARGQDDRGPRPGLQAQHRRHARGQEPRGRRGCSTRRAPRSAPTTRWRWTTREPLLPEGVVFCESPTRRPTGADAVVLLTEWNEFKYLNLDRLRGAAAAAG